jgi:plasmid stabilization system protein ParE
MAEKIILWKDQPKRQLQELLTYLKEHDSHTAASNFLKKLKVKSNRLKKYPGSGQRTRFKTIRRVRIDKYRSLLQGSWKKDFHPVSLGWTARSRQESL